MQFVRIFEIVISLPIAFCNIHSKKNLQNINVTSKDAISAPIKQ